MKKYFSKKTGELIYIELDIQIQDENNHTITAKPIGLKDNPLFLNESIILQIKPTKISKGLGDSEGDVRAKRGEKYKLILKKL